MEKILVLGAMMAFPVAVAQSVKSCGGPNDHLKNPVIRLTPDPPALGGSLTIEASGTLDEALTAASSYVDLHVEALSVFRTRIQGGVPFMISPAPAAGPFSLKVGPLALPGSAAGKAVVRGQIRVADAKNESVMCIDLDLTVPGTIDGEPSAQELTAAEPPASCGKSTDHIPDFQLISAGGIATMTGMLDENLTEASVDLDMSVKVAFFHVPLKATVPLAFIPGMPKGAIKATVGPSTVVVSPEVQATLSGTMKVKDAHGEQVACISVDTVIADADAGLCSADDQMAINALPGGHDSGSFAKATSDCAHRALNIFKGIDQDRFNTCLRRNLNISADCSTCFAEAAQYGFKNCKARCLASWCSQTCLTCSEGFDVKGCAGFNGPQPTPCDFEQLVVI